MDKNTAQNLIRKVFQNPFNEESFVYFIKSLLNHIEPAPFIYRGNFIPDAYKPYIKTFERIGKYQDKNGKKIDILIVRLKKEKSLERARTMQRNFIAWYLNGSRGDILKDAALVAFVSPNSEDWRFSLVKMDYRLDASGEKVKVKQELTPARRFSFLVGKTESSHTAQSRLVPILQNDESDPTLKDLEDAFSVEKVTKEFFKELSNWYFWALEKVQFPMEAEKEKEDQKGRKIALIRFLTRIIFIWFMKQKGLVPEYLFDEKEVEKILTDLSGNKTTYYKAILQNLFFATLSTKKENRSLAKEGKWFGKGKGGSKDFTNQYAYRFRELFKSSNEEDIKRLFEEIPFINGGLFECLDDGENNVYIDGFTRRPKYQPIFPNKLFFSEEKSIDLNKYYGTKNKRYFVEGLINILKRYNFTIDESTPVEVTIALDPELLGRVFENLLASYNPETATTARKATGSYYTPRQIVHYMLDESLKAYFKNKLSGIENINEKIEELFSYDIDTHSFNKEEAEKIVRAIDGIKIIDPAVGSGAFPMGVLQRLVHLLSKLDPDNKIWRNIQKEKILKQFEGVLDIKDKKEREKALKEIDDTFERNTSSYGRKLYLIKNCIYGVDIQPIAIQIAKLRFFISLLVEMEVDKSKDNFGIEPLPNLETKFVVANSLIGLRNNSQLSFKDPKIELLENELKKIRDLYFATSDVKKKDKIRGDDEEKRKEIAKLLKKNGFAPESTQKIANWDPYNSNISADWFDPEWMFGIREGFDVVIANPPYVRQEKIRNQKPLLQEQNYEVYDSRADLYVYFYEKSYQLLKPNGVLCFISSNKWLRAKYGEKLRKFLKENTEIIELVDFGGFPVFEATVDTNIILFKKKKANKNHRVKFVNVKSGLENKNLILYFKENKNYILQKELKDNCWTLAGKKVLKLKEKIERTGTPLKDWNTRIFFGIKTGFNKAFIITTKKRNEILANCQTEEERKRTGKIIKPILRGRDIYRYGYKWAGLWLITARFGFWKEAKKYPAIKNHLMQYEKQLRNRGQCRYSRGGEINTNKEYTGQHHWLELDNNPKDKYLKEFEKEKIVWQEIVREPSFAYDSRKFYCEATSFLMTGNSLKYLIAILNSKPATFFFRQFYAGGGLGEEGYRYKKAFLERIPIPPITLKNQRIVNQIEDLVNKILTITEDDDYLQNKAKQKKVKEYEHQIDQLVYKLYGLMPEEIKIIEQNNER